MIIKINNFGPINEFSYDLSKDFIVTYGDNNIGKSYSMQIVYLLIKSLIEFFSMAPVSWGSFYHVGFGIMNDTNYDKYKKIVEEFVEKDSESKEVTQDLISIFFQSIGDAFLKSFINSCDNTFGNLEKTLEKEPTISLEFDQYDLLINLKEAKITGSTSIKPVYLKKTETDYFKLKNYKNYEAVYVSDTNLDKPINVLIEKNNKLVKDFIFFVNRNFGNVYFLPASRSGIYSGMNAFGSIVAELSKNRAYLTRKIELPGISEPISDYFIYLSSIKQKGSEKYLEYYSKIEDEILKGKVSIDKNKNALVYTPNELDMQFEMTEVSSMVSEVSPIVAFLKYILVSQKNKQRYMNAKPILFIEEPEAHLHPNNQIALIEIFAQLASEDIKLIVSSHSNYVFNKLNNLVLAKKLDYMIYQPIYLEMTNNGSYSRAMNIDELGADDNNFIDVSEKLYFEREEIIQKLNTEEE